MVPRYCSKAISTSVVRDRRLCSAAWSIALRSFFGIQTCKGTPERFGVFGGASAGLFMLLRFAIGGHCSRAQTLCNTIVGRV